MKAFFLSRVLREKLLLLALVLTAAVMWMTSAGKRSGKTWRAVKETSGYLENQEMVLGEKDNIEVRAKAALKQLDPARTFDQVRLMSEVNAIANAAGISNNSRGINPLQQESTSQFAVNSVEVTIRNAEYGSLVKFYTELKKRAPYLGIEQFRIQAPPNGSSHNAVMRISSFEFAK